jgi:hypothetical protein
MLGFFTPERAASMDTSTPDAVGSQIFDTQTTTSCRDDIAFVVLNQAMPGRSPLPIRLTDTTVAGEDVSVTGYGLTEIAGDPLALRTRDDMQIVGVGPDTPINITQPAPLRAVRIGPSAATCSGDSGGPITAASTGAVIAVVSLGFEAASSGPFCADQQTSDTTGPRLAEYSALATTAFQAAGQTPVLEPVGAEPATTTTSPEAAPPDAGTHTDAGSDVESVSVLSAEGGSCAVGQGAEGAGWVRWVVCGVTLVVGSRRRGLRHHKEVQRRPQASGGGGHNSRGPTRGSL